MITELVTPLFPLVVDELFGEGVPVIIDGFMVFTDGTLMQFTDDTV